MKKEYLKIINVVGARPNFVKIAPTIREMERYDNIKKILVHTGQHYDYEMSQAFFKDLQIPRPDINLEVKSLSSVLQIAEIMKRFEKVCLVKEPDLIVVVGDVNSTLACSLVANKLNIKLAHIEAGLRSRDMAMPEEINRIVSDHLSDYLFTTCEEANFNLKREGISEKKIFFVGNTMIDTLIELKTKSQKSNILEKIGLIKGGYALLTLHRPSNVDNKATLKRIFDAFNEISSYLKIVFPVHPRTKKRIKKFKIIINKNIKLIQPLGYLDFLKLHINSKFIATDSGGIQEESTYLGVPCLTVRENTERPITIREGTNVLVGTNREKIIYESLKILKNTQKIGKIPKFWDGNAAHRIVKILLNILKK